MFFVYTEDRAKSEKLHCYRCKNWGVRGDRFTGLHGMEIIIPHFTESESSMCCM